LSSGQRAEQLAEQVTAGLLARLDNSGSDE